MMLPWQQLSNCTTPSIDTASPHREELDNAHTIAPNVHEEFLFHDINTILQRNDGMALCSSWEEQLGMSAMPNFMCTDNCWHGHAFAHGGNHNAEDEWSIDLWEDLIKQTSQPSISPGYNFSSESSWTIPTNTSAPSVQPSPVYSEVSSVAVYQHDSHAPYINNHLNENLNSNRHIHAISTNTMYTSFSPSFCQPSGTCLANPDTSSLHPSPGYSEASSLAAANQHDSFYMSDDSKDHLQVHMGTHHSGINSVHASPKFGHGNVHGSYSGSSASNIGVSDDDLFENEASSLAHNQNLAIAGASSMEGRASRPLLNLEARANPLHEASRYSMNTTGANESSDDCEATKSGESVSFLVETNTPAIEDGYVWRKYGQKIIKDRLHPRSYFRCAQPNCSVKKQTESSSDTQGFVLITYFGRHNH